MRRVLLALVVGSFASLAACTVENNPTPPGGSSSGSTQTPDGSSSNNTGTPDGSTNNSSNAPPASTTEAEVDIDGTCSAFVACGGNPQGTFDYTGGCLDDVFSQARSACPALDTSNAVVKVKGSITFKGAALTRDATVTISGSITFPQTCSAGQCALLENELKSAFDSASCSGSSSCTCTISKTENEKDATTYTIQGSVVKTADGDEYTICEKGSDLSYSGASAGSEEGTFTMKKR